MHMLFKFKSKAASDLIMLEPDAKRLLNIIRNEAPAKGIVTAEQLPEAIAALELAIAADELRLAEALKAQLQARASKDSSGHGDQDEDREGGTALQAPTDTVSLKRRAQPMLDMLRRSLSAQVDVVWGV
jgi:hypothetical protein